jgi:hypothetical protein
LSAVQLVNSEQLQCLDDKGYVTVGQLLALLNHLASARSLLTRKGRASVAAAVGLGEELNLTIPELLALRTELRRILRAHLHTSRLRTVPNRRLSESTRLALPHIERVAKRTPSTAEFPRIIGSSRSGW